MLHNNVMEQKGGFRTLDANELEAVGGGNEIIVDGVRPSTDSWWNSDEGFWAWMDLADQAQFDAIMQTLAMQGLAQQAPPELDGPDLLDKLPDVPIPVELDERQQAFVAVLELLGVPGPLAVALAVATKALSSIEFKLAMNAFFDQVGIELNEFVFGPPNESSGDPVEDFYRLYGPLANPDFPE